MRTRLDGVSIRDIELLHAGVAGATVGGGGGEVLPVGDVEEIGGNRNGLGRKGAREVDEVMDADPRDLKGLRHWDRS